MNDTDDILPDDPTQDAAPDEVETLLNRIDQLITERDEAKADTMRAMAETQTVRRRGLDELRKQRDLAAQNLVAELLPVLDNFERTLEHLDAGTSVEKLSGGIAAVERQLRSILEAAGVQRVVSVGQPFDPEVHDALGTDITDEQPEDTVTFEFEPAYRMGDRVLRHARVKVAKAA